MKYFTMRELTNTWRPINNNPPPHVKENLEALVAKVLDPLREAFGKPISVSSGYRNPELNRIVKGVSNSQHLNGEAADIKGGSREANKQLFEIIRDTLPFDQLINEHDYQWIHVSYKRIGANRKQILKIG